MVELALPNGYRLLEEPWEQSIPVLPGHYVISHNTRLYIFDAKPGALTLLVPPTISGPIIFSSIHGEPLEPPSGEPTVMLLDDANFAAGIFYLKKYRRQFKGVVLIGTDIGFPFHPCPSRHLTPHLPAHLIAANPLLEDWGILNRLANTHEQPGCFEGTVEDLAKLWATIPDLIP